MYLIIKINTFRVRYVSLKTLLEISQRLHFQYLYF